ncbi:MAG: hypothetical protein QNJ74_05500 [Trichodesmium sp. MO_231.B1]|nr:hypothetical protein [Trichodesmium sp. MO_231.B1]
MESITQSAKAPLNHLDVTSQLKKYLHILGILLLITTTLIWGTTFPIIKRKRRTRNSKITIAEEG